MILMIMLTAAVTENFVFARFLGICPFIGVSQRPKIAASMGAAVMFVMTIACFVTWLIYHFILSNPYFDLVYLRTIVFILIIASLVQLLEMYLKKMVPALHATLGIYLPLIATNCAILGAAFLAVENYDNLFVAIIFSVFSAAGFTMALLIFAGVRERLVFADPPPFFKGLPLTLISAGLLAMAFMGFQGVSL